MFLSNYAVVEKDICLKYFATLLAQVAISALPAVLRMSTSVGVLSRLAAFSNVDLK